MKCYLVLWVQRRQNCFPAASFANCVMTLYLFKAHLQTFICIPITQKCQILSCDTLVVNERYINERKALSKFGCKIQHCLVATHKWIFLDNSSNTEVLKHFLKTFILFNFQLFTICMHRYINANLNLYLMSLCLIYRHTNM